MKDIHCNECGRYLLKLAFGDIEIKCPKCKSLNKIKLTTYKQMLLTSEPEKVIIKP